MEAWIASLTALMTVPAYGLGGLFVASFVSATLLPLGSEVLLLALVRAEPALLWPALGVATLGNTLGGAFTWWMGRVAGRAAARFGHGPAPHARSRGWLERHGPAACLLAWLPVVGDPLCAVAGWLQLPFWRCVAAMAVGKFLRYVTLTVLVAGF